MHKRSRDRQELFCVTGDALVGDANSNGRLGGATLAAPASRAGLIDEYRLFGAPIMIPAASGSCLATYV